MNLFEILKRLNELDTLDNGTRVRIGYDLVNGQYSRKGDQLTFGTAPGVIRELSDETHFAMVILVDRSEYEKLEETPVEEKSCKNCKWLTGSHFNDPGIIGECANPNVQTRLCVPYGMLCNGTEWQSKT